MRNTGWYIPFWRKPKRSQGDNGQPERPERRRRPRQRTDDDLERVRRDWVIRYTTRVRALRTLGLSVGVTQEEISARYEQLLAEAETQPDGSPRRSDLYRAYQLLRSEA